MFSTSCLSFIGDMVQLDLASGRSVAHSEKSPVAGQVYGLLIINHIWNESGLHLYMFSILGNWTRPKPAIASRLHVGGGYLKTVLSFPIPSY